MAWWDILDPFNAQNPLTLPLRAADWAAMQIPGSVGALLTAITGGDASTQFNQYERNLNAGLGFTNPNGSFRPTLSGNTNAVPPVTWNDFGRAWAGGVGLSGEAVGQTTKDFALPLAKSLLDPTTLLLLAGLVYAMTRQSTPKHIRRARASYSAARGR